MIYIKGYIGNEEGEFNLLNLIEGVQKEQGDTIHIKINSLGGDLDVGFAMYDYLMSLDKTIITESEDNCASAATLPFIAGDTRIAGSPIMIHNPFLDGVTGDGDQLRRAAEYVEEAEKKAEKTYSERTGIEANVISELMKSDTYMSPSQAVTLGFATEAKQTVLARIENLSINKKNEQMSKKSAIDRLAEFLGPKKAKNEVVYNMDLSTATGETLYVEREEGDPQVGDAASPDGAHVMPDGSTIVVAEGVITEILPAAENEGEEGGGSEITEAEAEEAVKLIEEVIKENEVLKEENEKLKEEVVNARVILNKIKMAGGVDKVFRNFKTEYKPSARSGNSGKVEIQEENALRERINELKEKKGGK